MIDRKRVTDALMSAFLQDRNKRETGGSNRSSDIDLWNNDIGVPLGSPYCVSGPQYHIRRVAGRLLAKCLLPRTASSQKLWRETSDHLKTSAARSKVDFVPHRGMLAVFRSRSNSSRGHVAIVLHDGFHAGGKVFDTFEYNTNSAGSREGEGCLIRTRSLDGDRNLEFLGFIDLPAAFVAA